MRLQNMLRYAVGIALLLFILVKIRDAMRESTPVPASVAPRQKPDANLSDLRSEHSTENRNAIENDEPSHNDPLFTFL